MENLLINGKLSKYNISTIWTQHPSNGWLEVSDVSVVS